MKIIKYWKASDFESNFCVCFATKEAAEQAAKGNGFWGTDAGVFPDQLKIYDSFEEWYSYKHPTLEQTNPELFKVIKGLSDSDVEILKKNGLKT